VLLAGVLLSLAVAVGFVNLAIARGAVLAELRAEEARVAQMKEQNSRLQDELERAQQGQNIGPLAERYFNLVPPGTTVVLPETPATPDSTSKRRRQVGPPYWTEWWKRLTQP
jgi:hypothetical protein